MLALEMHKLYMLMKDSLNNEEALKASISQETKYKYEKQKAIDEINYEKKRILEEAEHEKKIAIEREEKAKQKIVIYAIAGGLVMVFLFFLFVFNRLRVTRQQKQLIEEQKRTVESAHSE